MFQVILYQPEIPPNTGNIIRDCGRFARNPGDELHFHAVEQGMGFYAPRRQRVPPEREFFYEISMKFN